MAVDPEANLTETTEGTRMGALGAYAGNVSCSIVDTDNALESLEGGSEDK